MRGIRPCADTASCFTITPSSISHIAILLPIEDAEIFPVGILGRDDRLEGLEAREDSFETSVVGPEKEVRLVLEGTDEQEARRGIIATVIDLVEVAVEVADIAQQQQQRQQQWRLRMCHGSNQMMVSFAFGGKLALGAVLATLGPVGLLLQRGWE
ncbi:hypothetical protein AK812_SmicGene39402 [Symbiodinium microadriaticum]|uniref:Uncharacterized protein n=1 Tax=Symbiodinium microadriaticum TaxID=2951 RepID=A0A1Q9CB99_SYMMI|nr:hypothetical protein AK812_SmicGene39402 [Symbiodinium microadriaticum]